MDPMIDILGELSTEEFDIQVGPIGPAPALRQRLRSMPQVQAVIKALSEGKLTELDVSNHVGGLCKDFRTGERFAHDLALSAMAVAMEDWEADFAEGSLRILSKLRLPELTIASRVAKFCLKQRAIKNRQLLGDYVTTSEHGIYPRGSKCVVYREFPELLILKMEDGVEVELDEREFYCPRLDFSCELALILSDILAAMDAQVFRDIDKATLDDVENKPKGAPPP